MIGHASFLRLERVLPATFALCSAGLSLIGAEVTITRTNLAERWITNVIEVRMPVNRFVNEYHTNWVTLTRTNIVDVYLTNWTMLKATNVVRVETTWTNHVTAFQTNWNTLNLTNWQTMVLFKTNWLNQTATNVVQIDLPGPPVAAAVAPSELPTPREVPMPTALPAPAGVWAGPLAIEASRTSRPPANDLVEVQMKIRRTDNTESPSQVQQWRVEREDAAILLFGQDQEFKRELPVGTYRVEAKLKPEGDNPPFSVRGTLSVTTHDAVIQPRLLVKK